MAGGCESNQGDVPSAAQRGGGEGFVILATTLGLPHEKV